MNEKQNQVCCNLLQKWAINSRIVSWTDELDRALKISTSSSGNFQLDVFFINKLHNWSLYMYIFA